MKKLFLLPLLFMFFGNVFAEPVSEEVARQAAKNFMQHFSRLKSGVVDLSIEKRTTYNSTTTFYTFSMNGGGWILISADNAATPVLAYSTTGEWDEDNMSPTTRKWIESYSKEIYEAVQSRQTNEASEAEWQDLLDKQFNDAVTTVAPLLKTEWDQSKYYNDLCPVSSEAPLGYGGHVPAGCVAITMAQIMKYYNYPAQGVGSYSYTHPTFGPLAANFGSTDYNWEAMPLKATSTNSALATLIYHCGIAVDMNYDSDGSGAISEMVPEAMKDYFNFDNTIKLFARENVGSDELWRALLRTELDASRPVFYAGSGTAGGHAFVCDGYDSSNPTKFHINWGWSGYNNGYYAIGALTTSNGAFNDFNRIIVGIKPRANANYICRIVNPTDGIGINPGAELSVSVKTVKGNTNKVILYLDGIKKDSSSTAPFGFKVSTATLAVGPHTISIRATDGTTWDTHQAGFNMLSSCWKLQNVTFSTDSVYVAQISAVDEKVVWASLKDYSSKEQPLRKFIKTVSGGNIWTEGTIDCSTCNTMSISNIHALNANKAYACLNPGTTTGGAILVTEDGGSTWTLQSSANFSNSWANWVYFFDENNGVCMGDSYRGLMASNFNFVVYTTNNGGNTWSRVGASNLPAALANEAGTVNFFDAIGNTIWFGTGNGRIYKSTDKGNNWTVKDGVLGAVQTDVRFKDALNGYAFGGYNTSDYSVKKTSDGGTTWVEDFPGGSISGQDYEYVPGTSSTWVNSGFYSSVSTNDNNSFYWLDYNTVISTTQFLSSTLGWGGGQYSLKNGGGIYKWTGNFNPIITTKVVLRVKDSNKNPVQGARTVFNYQVKSTNEKGLADFELRSFGNPESYIVTKEGFSSVAENYYAAGEDTVDIILPAAHAVSFTVKNKSNAAISGATVIFNNTSLLTDVNGVATFTNVSKGLSYPYAVTKSRYYSGYGSIDIKDGSNSCDVVLISDATPVLSKEESRHVIFPNPASEFLNVMSENTISAIELIAMNGRVVFSQTFNTNAVQVPLTNVMDGEYIVKVVQGKKIESKKVVVKR